MTVALAVILAGVLHAVWNAIAKGAPDRWASFALIGLGEALVVLPMGAVVGPPDRAAWPWLLASVAVHIVYMGLLLVSYQLGDFSQVYPLARGSAPLLVAAVAAAVLGERLTWAQDAGVAAVCGGLGVLAFAGRRDGAGKGGTAAGGGVVADGGVDAG
ncbi:EamA family transporter, partial [Spirillospora sp. NPDC046719]